MTAQQVATTISEIWNQLSKTAGWPTKKEPCDVLRNTRVIRKTLAGLELLNKLESSPNPKESISWVLTRWNWRKSPAPINLLENQDQWRALHATIQRTEEENKTARENRLLRLKEWATKEFNLGLQKKLSILQIKKDIERFSHATKKTQGLSIQEKLEFLTFIEEL